MHLSLLESMEGYIRHDHVHEMDSRRILSRSECDNFFHKKKKRKILCVFAVAVHMHLVLNLVFNPLPVFDAASSCQTVRMRSFTI